MPHDYVLKMELRCWSEELDAWEFKRCEASPRKSIGFGSLGIDSIILIYEISFNV